MYCHEELHLRFCRTLNPDLDMYVPESFVKIKIDNLSLLESIEQKNMYRIYSSEHPGHSFNFGFSRDGAYLREALSFEGGTHYIYQKDIKILSACLFNQTMRTVIITRIKCLMFKIVCKTPLFTKEK